MKNLKKNRKKIKRCSADGCKGKFYAKGFCRLCYRRNERKGKPERDSGHNKGKRCSVAKCKKDAWARGMCPRHYYRVMKYGSSDIVLRATGEKNVNWKGGASEYKNHYTLKQNRLRRIKKEKGICQVCKKKGGKYCYHKDLNKDNHKFCNLILMCSKCMSKRRVLTRRKNKLKKT